MSSAYIINWRSFLALGKSLIYIINKRGPRIDPCGTLCCMSSMFSKKIQIVRIVSDLIDMCLASYMRCHLFHSVNFDNKIVWFNVSKALDKSRKILKGVLILSI